MLAGMPDKRRTQAAVSTPSLALGTASVRQSIVSGAIGVFAAHSFAEVRVEDILEASGVSRRTFYKHFRNKDEVLGAIYDFATGELLRAMQVSGPRPGDPLQMAHRVLDVYFDFHQANPRLLGTLMQQARDPHSPLAPFRRRFRDQLVELMDRAVRGSVGDKHDPLLYAALLAALEGTSLDLLLDGADDRVVARARKVMHELLDRTLGT
jgi:AcrR family transcriptional regulator